MLSVLLTAACAFSVSAGATAAEDELYSAQYMSSPYYARLIRTLESADDMTVMERTLAVAQSQEGYLNYATSGINIEQAKAEGKLWTGAELRMDANLTGNTEYTRWAQRYILNGDEESQYADYDWCAIFVSWCMFQAGYYSREELKEYYYSYCADPRIFFDADSWIGSFNFDQHNVYYVPKAHHKLDAMDWNTYYHVDVDPYDIPYRPGGVIFFTWNASGDYFNHVALVVGYDESTHILTYINGNTDGQVITREMDLDDEAYTASGYVANAERIMAYAEYDGIKPFEQRKITAETPVITWDKSASSGIKIRTDTDSVMARVYIDGAYHGSIIESNMIFHEGLLTIGKSELRNLPVGKNKMTLVFDDGEVDVTLYVTDTQSQPMGKIGDADSDGEVAILDATRIQRYLVNLSELSQVQLCLADTDRDGEVTVLDATYIQRWLVNLPDDKPVGMDI